MPTKKGGGGKPQEYDPSNGRYGGGSLGYTKNYGKAESIISVFPTMGNEQKTSKIMPNFKKAITPDDKFLKYSLDANHPIGKHKATVYKKVLGYTKDNYSTLKNQIHEAVINGRAILNSVSKNEAGTVKFTYLIEVSGPNGNSAKVVAVYGFNKTSGKPRMITNYINKR